MQLLWRLRKFFHRKTLPMQVVFTVPFIVQLTTAVILIGYISLLNAQEAVPEFVQEISTRVSYNVRQHLDIAVCRIM
jgi:hypothetical protein